MKEQKLIEAINDTKLYIMQYVNEFEGELTDDEHDALAVLIDVCATAKEISYGKMKLRSLNRRFAREKGEA